MNYKVVIEKKLTLLDMKLEEFSGWKIPSFDLLCKDKMLLSAIARVLQVMIDIELDEALVE